ncbi:glycosyltransferase family 4 protein [Candidatus Fermentibacterales bacterium]|nr:glycosyltransferase family 4 protein [Candidatus Fermentibacterales bacterium]
MKVVINSAVLSNPLTGVARYAFELGAALGGLDSVSVEYWASRSFRDRLRQHLDPGSVYRTFRHLRGLGPAVLPALMSAAHGVDVVHFPNGDLLPCPVPRTAMVHDLAPFILEDLLPRRLTEHYRGRTQRIVGRCRAIMVNSRTTMSDLLERFPEAEGRCFLTIPGSDHRRASDGKVPLPPGLRPGYLLSVGTMEPRKNYDRLIRAYGNLVTARAGEEVPPLVICGGPGYLSAETIRLASSLGLGERVRFTGYVSEEVLSTLYRNARAYVHPSLYEGFCFPVAEAIRAGLPVAAADNSAIRELYSGMYEPFDALDIGSITSALTPIALHDVSAPAPDARRELLASLSWRACAERTLEALRSACG